MEDDEEIYKQLENLDAELLEGFRQRRHEPDPGQKPHDH